jgi:hypothetical protein
MAEINLIESAIMNPIAPMIKMPKAETFATVLNSSDVGFLKICQTRFDCKTNDFIFSNAMVLRDLEGF